MDSIKYRYIRQDLQDHPDKRPAALGYIDAGDVNPINPVNHVKKIKDRIHSTPSINLSSLGKI